MQNRTHVRIMQLSDWGELRMTSYEEETDYRNVPRELLDNNIPMGRGMIKWAAFIICTNLIKNLI
ncbi:hypothetical protein JMD85_09625 [Staphylococcus aureus]|nr:hypothetical protein JMD85_09625 [Staphylococcus aureus]QSV01677.1 hypothetical protein JMD62_09505 [Staphylococcus aureus]HDJ2164728.1 hypothetical protein [Staphylococcus aureus]HDJ2165675.1 hypothetical protein [Staphylococcus aureus]HDJ2430061.1 hypothetical protein [Staphylococcus aureus]